ncbi:MAG: fibronectin type III domain-containing protein, partial [Bacteroidales bacterium]|nr:fibronectin type III domain-containing protein [Bacteroidales bacterium]
DPVTNLAAAYDVNCQAILTWDEPEALGLTGSMTLWDNTDIGIGSEGLISSYWSGNNNWVIVADDFDASGAWTIEKIYSQGYSNIPSSLPTKMSVVIYENAAGNKPGAELYRNNAIAVTDGEAPEIILPEPFTLPGAGKYWISIAGVYNASVSSYSSIIYYRWNIYCGSEKVGVNFQSHDPLNLLGKGSDWLDASGSGAAYSMYFKIEGDPNGSSVFAYNIYRDGALVKSNHPTPYYVDAEFDAYSAHEWEVKVVCDALESDAATTSLPSCKVLLCENTEEKQIGTGTTGTSNLPLNNSFEYSYSQQIYDADDLSDYICRDISSISFYNIRATSTTKSPVMIYLGTTTKTEFASNTDWVPSSQLELVYTGDFTFGGAAGWVTIHFDAPFTYMGNNLVVAFKNDDGVWGDSNNNFYVTETESLNKSMYNRRDMFPIDPASPPNATGRLTNRCNIKFEICPESTVCNPPTNLMATYNVECEAKLTWVPAVGGGCNPYYYNVYRDGEIIVSNISETFYTDTEFDALEGHIYEVKTVCGGGESESAIVTLDACDDGCPNVIIGTGTNGNLNMPVNTYYSYSYVQHLFTAGEIGTAGTITKLAFQYIATIPNVKNNQVYYLGNTTKTVFDSTSDWTPLSELTQVFEGNLVYDDANNWYVIEFQTPFEYTGCNLVLAVLNNHGSYASNYDILTFHVTALETGNNKTLRYHKDNTPAGPINPASVPAGTLDINRTNTLFHICPSESYQPESPVATAATDVTCTSFIANWEPVLGADNYLLSVYTENDIYILTDQPTTNVTSYTVNGLTSGITYYYYLKTITTCYTSDASNEIEVAVQPLYTITAAAGTNGNITPSGVITLDCGVTEQTFTFAPDGECYEIDEVLIDNENDATAVENGYYTFEDISA